MIRILILIARLALPVAIIAAAIGAGVRRARDRRKYGGEIETEFVEEEAERDD